MLQTLEEALIERFDATRIDESTGEKISSEQVRDVFKDMIEIHKKYFPNTFETFRLSPLGRAAVFFTSTVHPKEKWPNGYAENDPMMTTFSITSSGEKYVLELLNGSGLRIKPGPGSYMAFDTVKVPFRKYTGTAEQVLKKFEEFEKKRKATYDANVDNLKIV